MVTVSSQTVLTKQMRRMKTLCQLWPKSEHHVSVIYHLSLIGIPDLQVNIVGQLMQRMITWKKKKFQEDLKLKPRYRMVLRNLYE